MNPTDKLLKDLSVVKDNIVLLNQIVSAASDKNDLKQVCLLSK